MAFKTFDRKSEIFSVGGLKAGFEFRTESSISFNLWTDGSLGDSLGKGFGALSAYPVRSMKGYVDVHYPCQEHIKLQIRIVLPKAIIDGYDHKTRVSFFHKIIEVLDIPSDETYVMQFSANEGGIIYANHTDRHGLSDGI